MKRVLLFAGTTEGRKIAEYCEEHGIEALVCVATEYGESLLPKSQRIQVLAGRADEEDMRHLMAGEAFELAVDATHPHAVQVTENIRAACRRAALPYVRLLRAGNAAAGDWDVQRVVSAADAGEAARYLSERPGKVFLATGSKELEAFASMDGFRDRVYARILPLPDMIQKAARLGLSGSHIIAMQGPFSQEMNEAMFRQTEARYLVTKESGREGGFAEKMEAAMACGMTAVVIKRPVKEEGKTFEEIVDILRFHYPDCGKAALTCVPSHESSGPDVTGIFMDSSETSSDVGDDSSLEITLVGIGMGNMETVTKEAEEKICAAQLVMGAKRMIRHPLCLGKDTHEAYTPRAVGDYIRKHPEYHRIVVLFSGDSGFFSGAAGEKAVWNAVGGKKCRIETLPGISSLSCLAARWGMGWQDSVILSAHGRDCAPAAAVSRFPKTFFLLDGERNLAWLCRRLEEYGLGEAEVFAGRDLGSRREQLMRGTPGEVSRQLIHGKQAELECAFVCRPLTDDEGNGGLEDEKFLRADGIPMTKREARSVSMARLQVGDDSVIYDIGAGTGAMTAEIARTAWRGTVYAIEKKEEAVHLLEENCRRLHMDQVTVIHGTAPQALEGLPAPTHAFIGGSGGNIRDIIKALLKKNPSVRIVVNAIALETVAKMSEILESGMFAHEDVVQLTTARVHKAGPYHLMKGENPIYVYTLQGGLVIWQ